MRNRGGLRCRIDRLERQPGDARLFQSGEESSRGCDSRIGREFQIQAHGGRIGHNPIAAGIQLGNGRPAR